VADKIGTPGCRLQVPGHGTGHDIQTGRKAGKTSRASRAAQQGPKCDQKGPKFHGVMRTGEARGWIRWSRQTWRPGAADTKSHLDWEEQ